jgi:hypothetical protein
MCSVYEPAYLTTANSVSVQVLCRIPEDSIDTYISNISSSYPAALIIALIQFQLSYS